MLFKNRRKEKETGRNTRSEFSLKNYNLSSTSFFPDYNSTHTPIPHSVCKTEYELIPSKAFCRHARGCAEIRVYCDHANSISFQIQDEGVRSEITERGIFLMKFSACQQKIMLILWRFHYISFTYLTAANGAGFRNYIIMYLVSNMIFLVSIEEFRTELNFSSFFL